MARRPRYGPHKYQYLLGKRQNNFTAQVEGIVNKTDQKLVALARETTQRVIDDAQLPTARGGRMRVDTGFLRGSGRLSLNGMPSGPSRPVEGATYPYDERAVELTLGRVELGDTIFFGWSAEYAKYREAYDGFLQAAIQNWPQHVANVITELNRRFR
jgi:hypothetical protein